MEKPSLIVIEEIAENDQEFKESIIEIIKKEFPLEVHKFNKNILLEDFQEASNNVHKLKHKISLLGLEKGLKIASKLEKQLKKGETKLLEKFIEILNKIHVYLYDQKN